MKSGACEGFEGTEVGGLSLHGWKEKLFDDDGEDAGDKEACGEIHHLRRC